MNGGSRLERIVRGLGLALGLAALLWVVATARRELGGLEPGAIRTRASALPLAIPLHLVALLAVGASWWRLLRSTSGAAVPLSAAWGIWGRANIAKYLPGNVMHFLGRQLDGARLGVSQRALAVATAVEAASLLVVAAILSGVLAGRGPGPWILAPAIVGLAIAAWLGRRSVVGGAESAGSSGDGRGPTETPRVADLLPWRALPLVAALHLVFFVLAAAAIVLLLPDGRAGGAGYTLVAGAFAAAWISGTVVPGAPGGLGVREAVLAGALQQAMPPGEAAAVAILARLVALGADVLLAGACWTLGSGGRRSRRASAPP